MYEYSVEELEIYYEAILRRRASETRRWGTAMRVATHAGKRGWGSYIRRLENLWKDIEISAGRFPQRVHSFFNALENVGRKPDGDH